MTIEKIIAELNESQKKAAVHMGNHALVLAGAGCGKTKTIISRAAFLISIGVPADRIQILTFTRRSSNEIVNRVKMHFGEIGNGLNASTFHTWCTKIIRGAPNSFGLKNFTVIDRDDQLQLFKMIRGNRSKFKFPTASQMCDLYSYARNTKSSLSISIENTLGQYSDQLEEIALVMRDYESRKKSRNYLDYDDILDIVARGIQKYEELRVWVGLQYDHILIDEMQDTNPLQWSLLEPLAKYSTLFCVGDDAQSIYGFRGADFENIHNFKNKLPNSTVFRLEDNYRSTQEILDISNWLLSASPIKYDKNLISIRGKGPVPKIYTFNNEWEEGRWIAEDILKRKHNGALWKQHMVLVRSGFSARKTEAALIAKDIPYLFIGGTKLLESAHVKDVLSVLRVVGNNKDEIGWMRYLTLWPGIGEVSAGKLTSELISTDTTNAAISWLEENGYQDVGFLMVIKNILNVENSVSLAINRAIELMDKLLLEKYKNLDWERRKNDLLFLEKLAAKHTSMLEFLEEYILDPIYNSERDNFQTDDVVTVITVHSAKGTEREVCYVQNASVGAFPSSFAIGDLKKIEEERRVLYVALTRAKNELIITRKERALSSIKNHKNSDISMPVSNVNKDVDDNDESKELIEAYFFNDLPIELVEECVCINDLTKLKKFVAEKKFEIDFGIDLN